jgi:phospholipase/carboxylesterase
VDRTSPGSQGRLTARPSAGTSSAAGARRPGVHLLGLGARRDGLVLVPAAAAAGEPRPLVVALHGAGGTGAQMIDLLEPSASRRRLFVLAPDSRARTWDVIAGGGYGPDVEFIDDALAAVFAAYPVGPTAIGGFSDGASYALSLGLANGDLFGHVLAWSPGFAAPGSQVGGPRVFVSHGTGDRVLPIERCSRRIVPRLRNEGYDVVYREFDGGHTVPREQIEAALDLLPGAG